MTSMVVMETGRFLINTDRSKLDLEVIHRFLASSYWAAGIQRATVVRSIENSLCFGVYNGGEQVGFARVISDFATAELVHYENLGLCGDGEAGKFIDSGGGVHPSLGGHDPVNVSGGLLSKGHPLGATGLAQCAELNWQLRGEADKRQVPGAKIALQHNLGLGGAAVVTAYRKGF